MASPLFDPGSQIQARREKRRQDWSSQYNDRIGRGDNPGLAGSIDPLNTMDLADQQGWDLNDAAPPIRPASGRIEGYEPQAARPGGVMRMASNTSQGDYFPPMQAQCTGPNCNQGVPQERIISERVTKINGVPVEQLGASQAPASMQGVPMAAVAATPAFDFGQAYIAATTGPVEKRASVWASLANQHRQAMTMLDPRTDYSRWQHEKTQYDKALMNAIQAGNMATAKAAYDQRRNDMFPLREAALARAMSGSIDGALSQVDKVLGGVNRPLEQRVDAVVDAYRERMSAPTVKGGPPAELTTEQQERLAGTARALTVVAAAHDIGHELVLNQARKDSNVDLPESSDMSVLMPGAMRAMKVAYGGRPVNREAVLLHMEPTVASRYASYMARTNPDAVPEQLEATARAAARATISMLHKQYMESFSGGQPATPVAATKPQPEPVFSREPSGPVAAPTPEPAAPSSTSRATIPTRTQVSW